MLCREQAEAVDDEPGLHTGEHASAEARFAKAATQLQGRDKLDREQLRDLRRQMRAEKKVHGGAASTEQYEFIAQFRCRKGFTKMQLLKASCAVDMRTI